MLLVKTFIDRSSINGIGLFADEDIPKGKVIWDYTIGLDKTWSVHVVKNMPDSKMKEFLLKYAYLDNGIGIPQYVLCVDDARFMNHSDNPNTSNGEKGVLMDTTIANCDIKKGEELTCNYYEIDDDAHNKFKVSI